MTTAADLEWVRLHRLANGEFDFRVRQILPEYWSASTPCAEWDIFGLVEHVTVENLKVPMVLAGGAPAVISERFDPPADDEDGWFVGDRASVLDGDPEMAWARAHHEAVGAFDQSDMSGIVELSLGPVPIIEYLRQRTADVLIHAWDLSQGLGVDDRLDEEVVIAVFEWASPLISRLDSSPDRFEPSVEPEPWADLQTRLLNLFGREV